jgi:hypothetical protein
MSQDTLKNGVASPVRRTPVLAVVTFLLVLAALLPATLTSSVHHDETQYVWSAAYYGQKVAHIDFRREGTDPFVDPGWEPNTWWPISQPMGTRYVVAAALAATGARAPAVPYSYVDTALQGPQTDVAWSTLVIARIAATLCAAGGFALMAWRWGARGVAVAVLLLAIPHARQDLARAWAEGPLLLGFGLCAATIGSRRFSYACGVAAVFKLTALGVWPLLLWPGACGARSERFACVRAVLGAAGIWSLLTPSSWYAGGPLYLVWMTFYRAHEYGGMTESSPGLFGLFLPTRYLLPLELAGAVAVVIVVSAWRRGPAGQGHVGVHGTSRPGGRITPAQTATFDRA